MGRAASPLTLFSSPAPHPSPLGLHPQQAAQKSASVTPGLSQRRALLLNIRPLRRGGGGGEGRAGLFGDPALGTHPNTSDWTTHGTAVPEGLK